MKEAYLPKEETLLTEIRKWKNTENLCGNVYDEGAVKSRSFQKLKLQEYKRLYQKYKGSSLSVDELALHQMLRYQYRKIEKSLFPSRLVRVGRRLWTAVRAKAERVLAGGPSGVANAAEMQRDFVSRGMGKPVGPSVAEQAEKEEPEQKKRPEGWWVNDLGRKDKSSRKDHKLGLH